jgi:hypothetical protein
MTDSEKKEFSTTQPAGEVNAELKEEELSGEKNSAIESLEKKTMPEMAPSNPGDGFGSQFSKEIQENITPAPELPPRTKKIAISEVPASTVYPKTSDATIDELDRLEKEVLALYPEEELPSLPVSPQNSTMATQEALPRNDVAEPSIIEQPLPPAPRPKEQLAPNVTPENIMPPVPLQKEKTDVVEVSDDPEKVSELSAEEKRQKDEWVAYLKRREILEAKDVLGETLADMKQAKSPEERSRLFQELAALYQKQGEGRNLVRDAENRAREALKDGKINGRRMKVTSAKNATMELLPATEEEVKEIAYRKAQKHCWKNLPEPQKKNFLGKDGKLDTRKFEKYLEGRREKLEISQEAFSIAVGDGYALDENKTGFWNIFQAAKHIDFGGGVVIPLEKGNRYFSKKQWRVFKKSLEARADQKVSDDASLLLDERINNGKTLFKDAQQKSAEDLVNEVIEAIEDKEKEAKKADDESIVSEKAANEALKTPEKKSVKKKVPRSPRKNIGKERHGFRKKTVSKNK